MREVGHEVGPGAVEAELQQRGQDRAAADGAADQKGRAALAHREQVEDDADHQKGQHSDSSEGRQVRHHVRQPCRADRVAGVARLAKGLQDRLIEGVRVALQRLVGDRDEGEGAEGDDAHRDNGADFGEGEAAEVVQSLVRHGSSLKALL